MKKIILLFGCFLSLSLGCYAQNISNHAIGLRLGNNDGFGAEISYQHALSDVNRIEGDLGIRSGSNIKGFKLTGIYQWVWQLEGNFNWFAGAGGGLGSFKSKTDVVEVSSTGVFLSGNVGVEYHFDIPIQLALDVRPEIGFDDIYDDFGFDLGLSIRYKF